MESASFRAAWEAVLSECQLEYIPRKRLPGLAAQAGPEEIRFLLRESERLQREWEAIRETDAGDVSDDYWRQMLCLADVFRLIGGRAVLPLMKELDTGDVPQRVAAARALQSVARHVDADDFGDLLMRERHPEVRSALVAAASEPPPRREHWWQFWR